jgi:hypothetical protein
LHPRPGNRPSQRLLRGYSATSRAHERSLTVGIGQELRPASVVEDLINDQAHASGGHWPTLPLQGYRLATIAAVSLQFLDRAIAFAPSFWRTGCHISRAVEATRRRRRRRSRHPQTVAPRRKWSGGSPTCLGSWRAARAIPSGREPSISVTPSSASTEPTSRRRSGTPFRRDAFASTTPGGLRREGIPPPRPRRFWPRPHQIEGHAGRAIPAPSTLHKVLVARAIGER